MTRLLPILAVFLSSGVAIAATEIPAKLRCVSLVKDHHDNVADFRIELKVDGDNTSDGNTEEVSVKAKSTVLNLNNGCDNNVTIEFKTWRLKNLEKGKFDAVLGTMTYEYSGDETQRPPFSVLCGKDE